MLSNLQNCYGLQTESVVIPNGRSRGAFKRAITKQPFICSAGRLWDDAKNIRQLNRICGELSWPAYAAGNPTHPARESQFRGEGNCRSLGHLTQAETADLLGRAAIFCAPAKYEPFGLAILEAALSGCALVLGDIDSLRELWNGVAVFIDPNDDRALIAALQSLIENPQERYRDLYLSVLKQFARAFRQGAFACGL